MNAFNHLHPAGRWRMLPKTTDGHQFGLVLPQLKPKNFSSCYNQITNRNMKSHKAMLDSGPFPLPSCVVWTRRLYSWVFFTAKGEGKLGGNSSSFKFNEPILPSLTSKQEHAQLQWGGYLEPWWQSEYSPAEGILGGHSGMHHATTLIPLHKMSLHQNKVLGDCRHDSTLATLLCRMSSCCWPYGIKFKRNKTNENTNSMESYQMSALDSIPGLGLTPSSGSWVSLPIREVRLHNV